jgi:hypothetical protein
MKNSIREINLRIILTIDYAWLETKMLYVSIKNKFKANLVMLKFIILKKKIK